MNHVLAGMESFVVDYLDDIVIYCTVPPGRNILIQGEERKPVVHISRKLYSAVELKCLAIKWAMDTLKYYIPGREFNLEPTIKCYNGWSR